MFPDSSDGKGVTFADVPDGLSNTIMVVEAADEKAVVRTKPDDFAYDEDDPLKGLVGLYPGGFFAAFADGSVQFLSASLQPDVVKALFTRNCGEDVKLP